MRFRRALIAHELDRTLFETVTAALKAKSIKVKTGTLVDATIIASASEHDGDARWVKKKERPAVHGLEAHVGADASTSLVEKVWITPANVHDGRAGHEALPDDPGEVFADSAYRGPHFGDAVRAKGGTPGSSRPRCGRAIRVRRTPSWTRGTPRSTGSALGSRRSSAPGSDATDCAACDGEVSPAPPSRSISPQPPTT